MEKLDFTIPQIKFMMDALDEFEGAETTSITESHAVSHIEDQVSGNVIHELSSAGILIVKKAIEYHILNTQSVGQTGFSLYNSIHPILSEYYTDGLRDMENKMRSSSPYRVAVPPPIHDVHTAEYEVICDAENHTVLSGRVFDNVVRICENPPEPTEAMNDLCARTRIQHGEDV